jgi:superoxide dismutase, Cu-Zn family
LKIVVAGPAGSAIKGVVYFSETPAAKYAPTSQVSVVAHIRGLTPGRHGFHIHENGVCDPPGYTTAGGHFDPGPFGHSNPVDSNHSYHAGDLASLEANSAGVAHLEYVTSRVTLRQSSGNALSLFDAKR